VEYTVGNGFGARLPRRFRSSRAPTDARAIRSAHGCGSDAARHARNRTSSRSSMSWTDLLASRTLRKG
jgi:hypothetical protein